jgi:hypothetical protein
MFLPWQNTCNPFNINRSRKGRNERAMVAKELQSNKNFVSSWFKIFRAMNLFDKIILILLYGHNVNMRSKKK